MQRLLNQIALVTGAGSGIGRATAVALASEGAIVVLVGRHEGPLHKTSDLIGDTAADWVMTCDVSVPEQVQALFAAVQSRFGRLDLLINNAGLNLAERQLAVLSTGDWQRILATNLDGPFLCVQGALPLMRAQRRGTMVHLGSNASYRPGRLAGAAYTASKAGLTALSEVINAEERVHGIRSSVIVLGDTNTPLLDKRPVPPPVEARALVVQPEDVAACVLLIATLPQRAIIEQLVLMPT